MYQSQGAAYISHGSGESENYTYKCRFFLYKSQGAACISPGSGEPENYTFNKGILRAMRQDGTTPRPDAWKTSDL